MPTELRKKLNTLSCLLYLYMLYIWYINTVYIIYREILYIISIYRKITCTFLAGNWQRKNSYFIFFLNLADVFLVLDKTDITSFHTVLSDNNFYSSGAKFAVVRTLVWLKRYWTACPVCIVIQVGNSAFTAWLLLLTRSMAKSSNLHSG